MKFKSHCGLDIFVHFSPTQLPALSVYMCAVGRVCDGLYLVAATRVHGGLRLVEGTPVHSGFSFE